LQRSRDDLIAIARRYYVDGKSQQEIAAEFGISRPTVSSLLKECKEKGIVEIRISEGSSHTAALSRELEERYQLQKAVVVSQSENITLLSRIGNEAASYTQSILRDGIQIGISWGMTLYQLVHQMQTVNISKAGVVQLTGGFGASNPQYDGTELARELSRKMQAGYYPLVCPVLVKNILVKDLLLNEPWIREVLHRTESLDAALVGISSNAPEASALVRAGFLSHEEAKDIQQAGAVGHICGYSYDKDGNVMDHPINHRIIGIDFHDFLNIPERIGAACGIQKAEAVRASLKGRHLTTLITDESIAAALV